MAVEDAHKISFLAGWVAMLEDVEGIGDVAERGTGKREDTRDRCRYGATIGRGSGRSDLSSSHRRPTSLSRNPRDKFLQAISAQKFDRDLPLLDVLLKGERRDPKRAFVAPPAATACRRIPRLRCLAH